MDEVKTYFRITGFHVHRLYGVPDFLWASCIEVYLRRIRMELPKNIQNRLNLLRYLGINPGNTKAVNLQISQLGQQRWFEWRNKQINDFREKVYHTGTREEIKRLLEPMRKKRNV